MEDNLKISKVECLSNSLFDNSNFKLRLRRPKQSVQILRMKMEDDLKILKAEYLSNHCMDRDLWVLRGKLEEMVRGNLECGSAQPSLLSLLSKLI
jgi:hypothetical protein